MLSVYKENWSYHARSGVACCFQCMLSSRTGVKYRQFDNRLFKEVKQRQETTDINGRQDTISRLMRFLKFIICQWGWWKHSYHSLEPPCLNLSSSKKIIFYSAVSSFPSTNTKIQLIKLPIRFTAEQTRLWRYLKLVHTCCHV